MRLFKRPKLTPAKSCPVEFPANLLGNIMPEIRAICQHENFEIRATEAQTNAANTHYSISPNHVASANLEAMIELCLDKSQNEFIYDYEELDADNFLGYCMTCGKSLVSCKQNEIVPHISLNVWAETDTGYYEGAPEQFFCSWTHLADFLVCLPDSAHLWMCMQYMYPGSMRLDKKTPLYIERAKNTTVQ